MARHNGVTPQFVFLIVLSSFYQLSLASICSSSGYSYQSQTYIDQSLTSPNYPFNYPRSTTCLWSLRRLSTSYAVRLTFLSFYLESSSGCTHDYVEIRDGDLLSTSRLIGKFCGTRMPPIIVSKYKFIFVRFVSDLDYFPSTRKFRATFRAIVPATSFSGKCSLSSPFLHNNNLLLSSSSGGTFKSPSYPSYYPNNMVCTWKITAPSGKRLKLSFNYFKLESGICSSNDYLEVRDGSSATSVKKGTYCGSYAPTITSSGRYLWVRFRSDSQLSYKGFEVRYSVVSTSSSKVGTIVGVLVAIAVIVAIIVIVIYFLKRKNRRVVTTQAVPIATTTTTVTTTQPPPPSAGYAQTTPQQYPPHVMQPGQPLLPGMQPGQPPPPGMQPGQPPPPGMQSGQPSAPGMLPGPPPGMVMNPGYGAYPPPPGAIPTSQVPPPYYPPEKAGPPTGSM